MHLCRAAWQRLAPLASSRGTAALLRKAPLRQMSSSSVPGSSGDALPYYLFVGISLTGAGVYVYRTLSSDRDRFQDRHSYLANRRKSKNTVLVQLYIKSEKYLSLIFYFESNLRLTEAEASDVSEVNEEAADVATLEAVAVAVEEVTEQEALPTESSETQEVVVEVVEMPAATEHAEEIEPTPNAEDAPAQVEQDIGSSDEVSEVTSSPTLEASVDNIQEELVSAAEDWTELYARKPEEAITETSQETQVTDETVESEEVAASS
ncbi:protein MGARP [Bombina bombina]|uniref:protein MGARP n=1 Tax=Bombina bombina TaxID=8345 RepID=UPI00235AFB00|nr:protein MGARP [Bombina bombina]